MFYERAANLDRFDFVPDIHTPEEYGGSLEIFYAMREELRFYLKRPQMLETILTANGIPIPEYDD